MSAFSLEERRSRRIYHRFGWVCNHLEASQEELVSNERREESCAEESSNHVDERIHFFEVYWCRVCQVELIDRGLEQGCNQFFPILVV